MWEPRSLETKILGHSRSSQVDQHSARLGQPSGDMASHPEGCRQVSPLPRPPPGSPGPLQTPVQPQSPDRAWPDQIGLWHSRRLPQATQRAGGPGLSRRTTPPWCPGDLVSCPAGPAPSVCTEITFPVTRGLSFSLWSWGRTEPSDPSPWSWFWKIKLGQDPRRQSWGLDPPPPPGLPKLSLQKLGVAAARKFAWVTPDMVTFPGLLGEDFMDFS